MRNYNITNLDELQAQKLALKAEYLFKEQALKTDIKDYSKQFTVGGIFRKLTNSKSVNKVDDHLNLSGSIMSFVLPILMNKTLFRGSGFITKSLVGLLSGKIGKNLDANNLSLIVNTLTGWVKNLGSKKRKPKFVDYGIPEDSETY